MNDDYGIEHNITQLFETLNTSLLLNRPDDVFSHLQQSLEQIKSGGLQQYQHETYKTKKVTILQNDCDKYNLDKLSKIGQTKVMKMSDYRIVIILIAPGEEKPIGRTLSKIFVDCNFINVGELLHKKLDNVESNGIARYTSAKSLLFNGDLVPPDVTLELVLDELNKTQTPLVIIDGYPKDMQQVIDLENAIGNDKILKVIAIDSYERECRDTMLDSYEHHSQREYHHPQVTERRLANYKAYTLPVLKHFQNLGKLLLISTQPDEIKLFHKITEALLVELPDIILKSKHTVNHYNLFHNFIDVTRNKIEKGLLKFKYSQWGSVFKPPLINTQEPIHRRSKLKSTPLVLLQGPAKSGKSTVAKAICDRLHGWYHFDFIHKRVPHEDTHVWDMVYKRNVCFVHNNLESASHYAVGIILENFPQDQIELNNFLRTIGKADLQLFIDVPKSTVIARYLNSCRKVNNIKVTNEDEESFESTADVNKKQDPLPNFTSVAEELYNFFQNNTLPVVRYFANQNISFDVDGNQTLEEVTNQFVNVIKSVFYKDEKYQ